MTSAKKNTEPRCGTGEGDDLEQVPRLGQVLSTDTPTTTAVNGQQRSKPQVDVSAASSASASSPEDIDENAAGRASTKSHDSAISQAESRGT